MSVVDATLRRRGRILSTVSDSVMVVIEELQPDDWTRSGSDLPRRGGSVVGVESDVDFVVGGGGGAAVVTSPVVLVGDVAVVVALPTVAGVASQPILLRLLLLMRFPWPMPGWSP